MRWHTRTCASNYRKEKTSSCKLRATATGAPSWPLYGVDVAKQMLEVLAEEDGLG
jgi:hypothetical protein